MSALTSSLLLILLLLFSPVTGQAHSPDREPIRIGAVLTLSGNFSAAGEDSRRGIEAALQSPENQGYLAIQCADSRNEPSTALSEYQRLVHIDRVMAIYTHRSSVGMALNPISKREALPLLGAVGHQGFAAQNPFAIQVWPRAHDEGRFVAEEFKRRNYSRVAVLYTEDEWTSSVTEGFRNRVRELGVTLIVDDAILPAEQDFRAAMLKFRQDPPDAVYLNVLLPQIAPVLKQARAASLSTAFFGNFYTAKKEVRDAAGKEAMEGVRYVELDNDLPKLQGLLNEHEPPPGLAVAAYLSTLLLPQAAREEPRPTNASDLMAALNRQKQVVSPDGSFAIVDRCVQMPLIVKQMRNGSFVRESLR